MADETQTKPAVKSTTIIANVLTGFFGVLALLPDILTSITPIISPHTAVILGVVTNLYSVYQRAQGENKPISGIVNQKD